MEVTKCLKPPDSGHEFGDCASVQAATRANAEQTSKRAMCRPTRKWDRGRLTRMGDFERGVRPSAAPGEWRQHIHKETAPHTPNPHASPAMVNRAPASTRP